MEDASRDATDRADVDVAVLVFLDFVDSVIRQTLLGGGFEDGLAVKATDAVIIATEPSCSVDLERPPRCCDSALKHTALGHLREGWEALG